MPDQHESSTQDLHVQIATRGQVRRQLIAAREELGREAYRLDTIEIQLEMAQSEIDKLESLSVAGVLSSLLGTKPGKIDARREEMEVLQREQQECERAIQTLTQSVEQIESELAGFAGIEAEFQEYSADQSNAPADRPMSTHEVQRALDAAESLLNNVGGAFRMCNKFRNGPQLAAGQGALLSTAMQAWRDKKAGSMTGQLADAVQHLVEQLGRLKLGHDRLPDVFALMPRLEPFAKSSSLDSNASTDAWAELEAITRSIVADLQDELRRIGG